MHPPQQIRPNNKLNQPQTPPSRSSKIDPKHTFQLHTPVFLIISEDLALAGQFTSEPFKYDIPGYKEIVSGPFTIIPEQPEWFPIGVSPIMWFSAAISCVTVIVTDVFDLLEIRLQKLYISGDEWAVVFFLSKIPACVIGCPHFGWSFHGGCPSFLVFVRGMYGGVGSDKIDFAFQN
jgi:hypothetical protein